MAYGKIKCDTLTYDASGSDTDISVSSLGAPEGTTVKSTGESGTTKFLRTDGDGTCSWNAVPIPVPTTITVADESSDTTCFPLFTTGATGDLAPKSGTNLTFNSDTGELAATLFSGSGASLTTLNASNISSGTIAAARVATLNQNTTGTAATVTGAAQTNITSVGTLTGLTIDGAYQQAFDVITPATSPAIDCSLGNYFTLDLSSTNVTGTWTFTNIPTTKSFAVAIEITTGGSTTIAWNSVNSNGGGASNKIKWPSGTAPTLAASKSHVVILTTDDTGATWYGAALVDYATA